MSIQERVVNFVVANWLTFTIGILALAVIALALVLVDRGGTYTMQLKTVLVALKNGYQYIISFQWLIKLAAWLRQVGSNISEAAFMLATIYVSIDFVAPQLVKWILPVEDWRAGMNELCSIAFTILPELILIASLLEVWKHVVFWRNGGGRRSVAWVVAYGLPTLCFLGMAVFTLGSAVVPHEVDHAALPNFVLIARAMAGFTYCVVQAIYAKGDDYSKLIDGIKAQTSKALADLKASEEKAKTTEEKAKDLEGKLQKALEENTQLLAGMQRKAAHENAVSEEMKPEDVIEWLRSTGRSTIALSDANSVMKQSKRRMDNAVKRGEIRPTKNKEIVFVDSLIDWYCKELSLPITEPLSAAPVPNGDDNTPDKLEITLSLLRDNPAITDEELMPHLNLKRAASARFWRLKAVEMMTKGEAMEQIESRIEESQAVEPDAGAQ